MQGDNLTWMTYFRQLISEKHLNHTFWCYNANSGDTGGLVLDDFTTWDEEKYAFVKEVLWQDEDGHFIGLDHAVPLGSNGIALSDWSGTTITPAASTPTPAAASDETEPSSASGTTPAEPVTPPAEGGSSAGRTVTIVVLSLIGVAAAAVIVVMIIKIRALPASGTKEEDPDAPVVVNGYLQKSNTYTPRPVYSNTAEARKAQAAKEAKKKAEENDKADEPEKPEGEE